MGATPLQVLSLAREMADTAVQLSVRGVATTTPFTMSRALRTGNKPDPFIFVRIFEECLAELVGVWEAMGIGFHLKSQDVHITHTLWVDNLFLLAGSLTEYDFMINALTCLLENRFGWTWKPTSLEMLMVRVPYPHNTYEVVANGSQLTYQVKPTMVALGGLLDTDSPHKSLIRYRLSQGDKCFYKYFKYMCSKKPVSLKLSAFAGSPRNSASFLLAVGHWSKENLLEIYRWERRHLVKMFRLRRKQEESQLKFNQRANLKLQNWMPIFKYTPFHAHVLERLYNHAWHERTVATLARAIRTDRGAMNWGAVSEVSAQKRRRPEGPVHARYLFVFWALAGGKI